MFPASTLPSSSLEKKMQGIFQKSLGYFDWNICSRIYFKLIWPVFMGFFQNWLSLNTFVQVLMNFGKLPGCLNWIRPCHSTRIQGRYIMLLWDFPPIPRRYFREQQKFEKRAPKTIFSKVSTSRKLE